MSIKVLVADDHEVVRIGLASLLKGTDIKIVAEATNGEEAVEQALKVRPDVVLLDIRMPETDGLAALEMIQKEAPGMKVVMLSAYDNPTYVARSIALGACDYVLKGSKRQTLITAITKAAAEESPSEDSLLFRIKAMMAKRQESTDEDVPLTKRELQVLRHVAFGLSNRDIGRSLGISIETVKEHVQNTLRKIGVNDRTKAAVWAVRRELV
jgi:DNA-binding NarL/FixJ family response regulator